MVGVFVFRSCGKDDAEKQPATTVDNGMKTLILGENVAEFPEGELDVEENSSDELWVVITGVSEKEYANFVEACINKGYTIDQEYDSEYFNAYNASGYELIIYYYEYDSEMEVELYAPKKMNDIVWPTGTAGKMLPIPKSNWGKFSYEHEDSFAVYIGNTTENDYSEYVAFCMEKGFNIDYSKGSTYFYADNVDGWHVAVEYKGFNTMYISINPPDTEEVTEPSADDTLENREEPETMGLDPNFKAAMDSYEAFVDEYVVFMKKYQANPSDITLLTEYTNYMSKYAQFVEDFEKWEDEDMNAVEMAYYLEVQTRVTQKMYGVAIGG